MLAFPISIPPEQSFFYVLHFTIRSVVLGVAFAALSALTLFGIQLAGHQEFVSRLTHMVSAQIGIFGTVLGFMALGVIAMAFFELGSLKTRLGAAHGILQDAP